MIQGSTKKNSSLSLRFSLGKLTTSDSPRSPETPTRNAIRKKLIENKEISLDKRELGIHLSNQLSPFCLKDTNETIGWQFNSGLTRLLKGKTNEINLFYLGTGSMPFFTEHKVMSEGGDVLCGLALQKGILQPCAIIKGIGTIDLHNSDSKEDKNNQFFPINSIFDPNVEYLGELSEVIGGAGIADRLKVSMETIFVPYLLKMIVNSKIESQTECSIIDVNIVGHSRGAITELYMINCINEWLYAIKNGNPDLVDIDTIAKMCGIKSSDVEMAIGLLKNRKIECKIHALLFDPVEGSTRSVDVEDFLFSNSTTIKVSIDGIYEPLVTQCSVMPEIVETAEIFIAEAERRKTFKPTVATFNPKTIVTYRVIPGTHSTMIGNIGNDDGDGQKSYVSVRENRFVEEAALASIDLLKIYSARFLFGDPLPPFQRHMLRRIFREDVDEKYAYVNTNHFLLDNLNIELKSNVAFKEFICLKIVDMGLGDGVDYEKALNTHNNLKVLGCEWLMNENAILAENAYLLLEKDIMELYLNPCESAKKFLLSKWQEEMKLDTTTLIQGPKTGFKYCAMQLQSKDEARNFFLRNIVFNEQFLREEVFNELSVDKIFPEFFTVDKRLTNPYFCLFSSLLQITEKCLLLEMLELDKCFLQLNALALKRKHHQGEGLNFLFESMAEKIGAFSDLLIISKLNLTLKENALFLFAQHIESYHMFSQKEIDMLIMEVWRLIQAKGNVFSARIAFIENKMILEKNQYLSTINSLLTEFALKYQQQDYNTLTVLEHKVENWKRIEIPHKVLPLLKKIKIEIREIMTPLTNKNFINRSVNFLLNGQRDSDFLTVLQHAINHLVKCEDTMLDYKKKITNLKHCVDTMQAHSFIIENTEPVLVSYLHKNNSERHKPVKNTVEDLSIKMEGLSLKLAKK